MKYVFAYGSLLNPESLAKTLPGIEVKMSLFLPIAKNGVR